ncbi:MAG: hypothetical protein DRN18_03175 [Thermoplasmata archaeon]|nr:MAG: hypothetical protein DRN18_03175 [Thermoplasmata archaeon]
MKEIKIKNWKMYSDEIIESPTFLWFYRMGREYVLTLENGKTMLSFYLTKKDAKKLFSDLLKLVDEDAKVLDNEKKN